MEKENNEITYASIDHVWKEIEVSFEGRIIKVDLTTNGFAGMLPVYCTLESAKNAGNKLIIPIQLV